MSRCLELAVNALGYTSPNPMVGCVIVHKGKIIGEGYHKACGQSHAEVNAILSVQNKELLKESTLYVNLEPCVHYGKTPPCTDLIINHNIPEVVVSLLDCYSEVAGKGIERLKKSGCNVIIGPLAKQSRELNKRFFTFYEKKRPYIILKWAQTTDGFIDILRNENTPKGPAWITNSYSDMLCHKWRTEEDAIIVGTNTAANDNPQLNARHWYGRSPLRITIDKDLKLPSSLNLFDNKYPTIVFTGKAKDDDTNVSYIQIDFNENIIQQIVKELYKLKVQSLIVEGGKTLLESFISKGLWDEARVLVSEKIFRKGLLAPSFPNEIHSEIMILRNKLLIFKNR